MARRNELNALQWTALGSSQEAGKDQNETSCYSSVYHRLYQYQLLLELEDLHLLQSRSGPEASMRPKLY